MSRAIDGATLTADRKAQIPHHLSYSSVSSYSDCGMKYLLERGYGLSSSTWYSTLAGKAIHYVTEQLDRKYELGLDVEVPTFEEAFAQEIKLSAEKGEEVRPSGRLLKQQSWAGGWITAPW